MKAFKILDRETGLYASPGYPGWTKNGKAWASPGAIAGHLALPGRSEQYRGERYAVVMFEAVKTLETSVDDYRKEIARRSHKKSRGRH